MQSVCLKGAGAEGPVAQETTLVGLTFGGYLRSKVLPYFDVLHRLMHLIIDCLLTIVQVILVLVIIPVLNCHDWDSQIKCMKCFAKSEQYERMMDLTVEIDGDIGTLEEALTQFTATEILDRENKYYCGRLVHVCAFGSNAHNAHLYFNKKSPVVPSAEFICVLIMLSHTD